MNPFLMFPRINPRCCIDFVSNNMGFFHSLAFVILQSYDDPTLAYPLLIIVVRKIILIKSGKEG